MRDTSMQLQVGNTVIGGKYVPIQTMIKNPVIDIDTTLRKIENLVAKKIFEATGRRGPDYEIISCPTCGRTNGDIHLMVQSIKSHLAGKILNRQIKIAVMGCVVNGPGEAEHADLGVACGKGKSMLFKHGKRIKIINNEDVINELFLLLEEYTG